MGARILLVEDDSSQAQRLATVLLAGAEPFTVVAVGAEGALAALAGEPFAGIVLDPQTAGGRGLLGRLRVDHPSLPIVALVDDEAARTGALGDGAAEAMLRRGAWADQLPTVLHEMLGRGALEEANARMARGLLVGREVELELLRGNVAAARAGHGRVVLIGGDAGIGKSALVGALSRHAAQTGCRVVWGHCHDGGGAPPYRPWAQVLRALLWHGDLDPFLDRLGAGGTELAQIEPAFAERLDLGQRPANADAEAARFRLFDSVAMCLRAVAHRQPLLLLLEDLHSADLSSLRLLHFVAQEIVAARVCIVATHRPPEGTPGHQVDAALAALRHAPTHVALPLRGLSSDAVRALLSAIAGQDVPADFAGAFHLRTEGNPLFVNEIARHLVEEHVLYFDGQQWTSRFTPEELPIPPGVADVIRRRLAHLSPACRDALAAAAVVGREFDAHLVAELAESPPAADAAALEEAQRGRVITAVADAAHTWRFAHPLIREILYGDLPVPRRVHLHRLVARALETLGPSEREARINELAYHFCEAAPDGDLDRALDYARRAGAAAARARAHEVSVRCYEMALRALRLAGASDDPRRAELLVLLGGSLWRIGEFARARQVAMQAIEMARRVGAVETLARAALCYAGDLQGFGLVVCDDTVVALLDESLRHLDERDSALRSALMARLSEELSIAPAEARRRALADEAVAMARRLEDPTVLGAVLRATHWALWTPEGVEERLALADEIVTLATRTGDPALRLDGQLFRVWALLECGGASRTRTALDHAIALVGDVRQSYYRWLLDTTRSCWAFAEGRLDDVERLVHESLAHAGAVDTPNVLLFAGVQRAHLRFMRGEFGPLADELRGFAEGYPLLGGVVQCSLAITASEAGDLGEARRLFEQLAANDFADLPRNVLWASCIACLSEVCASLQDERRARRLYELLRPFANQSIARPPVIVWASGAYYLARLAATMRRWDEATIHFEDAIQLDTGMGRRHWVARAQVAYAEMLIGSGNRSDYALSLLTDAVLTATDLQMPALLDRADALRRQIQPTAPPPPSDVVHGVCRRDGEIYHIGYGPRSCMVRANRAVVRMQMLLRHPRRPISALWLMRMNAGDAVPADDEDGYRGQNGHGAHLDGRAKRELAQRLREIDEALTAADQRQTRGLREEGEKIRRVRRAAVALGGRDRETGDDSERARQAMCKSKKALITRIDRELPELATYLDRCIHTGLVCMYEPDPARPVVWEF